MATDEDYPIDLPILVIEAQIFVAVKKLPFLPNKLIPNARLAQCLNSVLNVKALVNNFNQEKALVIVKTDRETDGSF